MDEPVNKGGEESWDEWVVCLCKTAPPSEGSRGGGAWWGAGFESESSSPGRRYQSRVNNEIVNELLNDGVTLPPLC